MLGRLSVILFLLLPSGVVAQTIDESIDEPISLVIQEVLAVKLKTPSAKPFRVIFSLADGSTVFFDGTRNTKREYDCIEKISELRIAEKDPAGLRLEFLGYLNGSSLKMSTGHETYKYRVAEISNCIVE